MENVEFALLEPENAFSKVIDSNRVISRWKNQSISTSTREIGSIWEE